MLGMESAIAALLAANEIAAVPVCSSKRDCSGPSSGGGVVLIADVYKRLPQHHLLLLYILTKGNETEL